MKWIPVHSSSTQDTYELWHNKKKLLTLISNPALGTARIDTDNEKRMFMIEAEGFLSSKTILRNEYGVKIGQLGHEKHTHEGTIELDDEHFYYTIQNIISPELIIYKTSVDEPLMVCGLSAIDGNTTIHLRDGKIRKDKTASSLLMALCWYLFMPAIQQTDAVYATGPAASFKY